MNTMKPIVLKNSINLGIETNFTIQEQKGGLFNDVYRITDGNKTWFAKQYLEQSTSSVFSPPKISPKLRSELAFEVQKKGYELTLDINSVPNVFLDKDSNTLFVRGVASPTDMIELISTCDFNISQGEVIAKSLGRLHQYYFNSEVTESPLYLNTQFRDFKLEIQYVNIGKELGEPYNKIILDLLENYKSSVQLLTVLHGDINSRNIILSDSEDSILGIIDFEQSHVGNPIYDISYFLCEVYISCLYFQKESLLEEFVHTFLEAYLAEATGFDLKAYAEELKLHLAIQLIYRFLGPSRNSWTFYIDEKEVIIEFGKEILISKKEPIIDKFTTKKA